MYCNFHFIKISLDFSFRRKMKSAEHVKIVNFDTINWTNKLDIPPDLPLTKDLQSHSTVILAELFNNKKPCNN